MENIPYILNISISLAILVIALIEVYLLIRIMFNQDNQSKIFQALIKDNHTITKNNTTVMQKVGDSMIRVEERIDKYQATTNQKLDIIKDIKRGSNRG